MFHTNVLLSVIDTIKDYFTSLGDKILNVFITIGSYLPKLLYFLTQCFMWMIDFCQIVFRKLAGIDTYYIKSAGSSQYIAQEGDVILDIIRDSRVYNVFIAMVLLAIVLLFATTIVAVIRSEYATEGQQNAKGRIIGRSIKALFSFVLVPVTIVLGLMVSNALLNALDGVTSNSTSTTFVSTEAGEQTVTSQKPTVNLYFISDGDVSSTTGTVEKGVFQLDSTSIGGLIFESSMYNCNRQRMDSRYLGDTQSDDRYGLRFGGIFVDDTSSAGMSDESVVTAADKIDMYFANGYAVSENTLDYETLKSSDKYRQIVGEWNTLWTGAPTMLRFNRYNPKQVFLYYNLWQLQWILPSWLAIITIFPAMIKLVFAMIKRMFELAMLFIISPPIAAMMPLDNGEALKKWRVRTVAVAIQAYACVVVMNLLFLLIPLFEEIRLFSSDLAFLNRLVYLIIISAGFGLINDFVKTIGDFLGSANSLDEGDKAGGLAKNTLLRAGTGLTSVAMAGINTARARIDETRKMKKSQTNRHISTEANKARDRAYKQALSEGKSEAEAQTIGEQASRDRAREVKWEHRFHPRRAWRGDYDNEGNLIRDTNGKVAINQELKNELKQKRSLEMHEELQDMSERLRGSLFSGTFLSFKEGNKADEENYGWKHLSRNVMRKQAKEHYDMKMVRSAAKQNAIGLRADERSPSMQTIAQERAEAARMAREEANRKETAKLIGQEVRKAMSATKKEGETDTTSVKAEKKESDS